MTQEPNLQLVRFRQAVAIIGGKVAAARLLGVSSRTISYLVGGEKALMTHHLRAIGKALIMHAETCRMLERALSPDFSGNLTPRQAKPRAGSKG